MDLIAMVLSGRDASKHEGSQTEARPAQQLVSRGADKPILWWWSILFLISAGNLVVWLVIARRVHGLSDGYVVQQLWLSGIFAAACAFRSILPRVDLEVSCWYAVISLNHLGHAIEEILWSIMVFLVALSLGLAWPHIPADIRILGGVGMAACTGAALLMLTVDVPVYLARWRRGRSSGARYLLVTEGLKDALQRRRVAHGWSEWRPEIPWMSLYFSASVWLSFCFVFA